jgi:hypothetical protein
MALTRIPPRQRVWNFQGNVVQPSGATGAQHAAQAFVTAKGQMLAFPAPGVVCSGSSDSITAGMDGADRITDRTKVVNANAGTAHSWAVLKLSATGQQVCYDFSSATGPWIATVVHSPQGLFSGGSITARPTAADEMVNRSGLDWLIGNNTTALNITSWCSADGLNLRVMFSTTTRLVAGLMMGKIIDPRPWITLPYVCSAFATGSPSSNTFSSPSAWVLPTVVSDGFTCRGPTNTFIRLGATPQVNLAGFLYQLTPTKNTLTGRWGMEQPGLYNLTAPDAGPFGQLADLFFCMGPAHGDISTDPIDASRITLQLGCLSLPWQASNWAIP